MDWVNRMNAAVDYIEEHIEGGEPIDEAALCRITACSFSLFQGSFTQISGLSLSEYIRRRKLTLATHDLQNTDEKVIDIALKYGYQSADAFTVAFKRMHGVSPMQAKKPGVKLTFYCRLRFALTIDEEWIKWITQSLNAERSASSGYGASRHTEAAHGLS
jgi:AraC family transcriptional regulator